MTERPLSITTQVATPILSTFISAASASNNDAPHAVESVDDEPYTIKCICQYSDDDGNTIYCETCDTWQHIECFYPGRVADASREEFDHSCADCKPRPLDRHNATERQRHQRQNKANNDGSDKKSKRPPSKSHKKKVKPSELQVNGFHDHDGHRNGSPLEHPTHPKKGHRSNKSINSQLKRSPPLNSRSNIHGHPPSPAHTPPDLPIDFQVHSYSDNFLSLYDGEEDVQETTTNSYVSLTVSNSMSEWLHSPESFVRDTGIPSAEEEFQYLKMAAEKMSWPELIVKRADTVINDIEVSWRFLVLSSALSLNRAVGELNGWIGFQKDYCDDPDNRWSDMPHSHPFVFFHPHLPLYIDTRREGSRSRYIRRSCRANTSLETFIESKSIYHFWLVSERSLDAGEQITLPWDFRFPEKHRRRYLRQLNLRDVDSPPSEAGSITEEEYSKLAQTVNEVLSEHGGCACGLGGDCAFTRFHRNHHRRAHVQSNGLKSKKGRKPKQNHASPTSTGHATNSRAASEGQDHYDDEDSRSVSGSSRSKPHSRDLTPLNEGDESNGIVTAPTEREKRKIQMAEDSFKKMEQPPRKKKRASDGSTTASQSSKPRQRSVVSRISVSHPLPANSNNGKSRYMDASTSRRQSGSPFSALSPTVLIPSPNNPASRAGSTAYRSRQGSMVPKGQYSHASTQTDDTDDAWWKQSTPTPKKTIVPLARRLLKNRQRIQSQQLVGRSEQPEPLQPSEDQNTSPVVAMDLDLPVRYTTQSPIDSKGRNASIASSTPSVDVSADVPMSDTPAILVSTAIKPPPPPWPISLNINGPHSHTQRSPDLRVQMPPTPTFSTPNMSGPLSASATPSSAAGSMAQSPFGTVHFSSIFPPVANGITSHASPVKATKKMSLSDYKANKAARLKRNDASHASNNSSNGGSSPTTTPAVLKPSLSTAEEAKAPETFESSAIVDTPVREKALDPMSTAVTPTHLPNESMAPHCKINIT